MNNPVTIAIFTAAVSLVVLVFSIFAASWLNQRNTERLLEQIDKRFDAFEGKMDARFAALQTELKTEIKRLDQRIDLLAQNNAQHFTAIESRLDRVERQLEAVFKPMLTR
ncbi:MAG: hypothetical protein HOP19_00230 [Acidobacteria bacterium]|nr:hypothetical protein [Acidobacteriota bacterium]